RDANDLDIRLGRAAAVEGVERTLQQAVGDNGIPASDHNRELHTGGGQVAFDGDGLAMQRILRLPEAENERWIECDREEARIPVRGRNVGEQLGNLFGAVVGDHPLLDNRMNLVELGNLDEDRRGGWHATGNQLEVADGREEGRATSAAILPALAGLEAKRPKEAGELVERSRRSDRRHQRDSLYHVSIVSSAFSGRLAAGPSVHLLTHGHEVEVVPCLRDLAVLDTRHRHARELNRIAFGWLAEPFTGMFRRDGTA